MEQDTKIIQEIAEPLKNMGFELVRLTWVGSEIKTLQLMVERLDRQDVALDDCAKISRTVSALLDVLDPVAGRWVLEVSSPGLDRPLVKPQDYVRFAGQEAKIELRSDINGRRRFKGTLVGLTDDQSNARFLFEGNEMLFPLAEIEKAKLLVSQNLFPVKNQK